MESINNEKNPQDKCRRIFTLLLFYIDITRATQSLWPNFQTEKCSSGGSLKYISGNALTDSPNCLGPNNAPYPSNVVARTFSNWNPSGSSRRGRMSQLPTLDPKVMQQTLMQTYSDVNDVAQEDVRTRYSRSVDNTQQCRDTPSRLCKTRYNTTAPMYGVSLTSGQPVTIVQKFPDLLQQVVFEVCE
ncbi:AAEL013120-PA [Aedes aegypti]|uniref:AAEL013120-PA n=1 Tax=Aedes aegypti TaxID=7159 RepID=Q16K48_AEDAE|nr:AAEL013120-PA [Aedes aegypti]